MSKEEKMIKDNCCPKCKSTEGYMNFCLEKLCIAFNYDGSVWGESSSRTEKEYKTVECIDCHHRWIPKKNTESD